MMTKNQGNERYQIEMITIDQLVPQDHLVRKLEAAIGLGKHQKWYK